MPKTEETNNSATHAGLSGPVARRAAALILGFSGILIAAICLIFFVTRAVVPAEKAKWRLYNYYTSYLINF